jgi:phosphoribosyl 1,2-cyclic phosphodiesterase
MSTIANNTKADKFYVTFWGTRGSISTPGSSTEKYGGNTPCISVRFRNTEVILDAGTGIRNLGLYLNQITPGSEDNMSIHLLLSHTHWDHIQGLPFFAPAYKKGTRIQIYGSPKKGNFLEAILHKQMDVNYFPVEMQALGAEISITEIRDQNLQIGDITVEWEEQVVHPGSSVRYKLKAAGKEIVYATDVELDKIFAPPVRAPEHAKLAAEYNKFIENADLLIADGQYTQEEYSTHVGFGHTSIPLLIDAAHRQKVKQLSVFHHDPQHSDTMLDRLWKAYAPQYALKEKPMNIFWAREGMTVAI